MATQPISEQSAGDRLISVEEYLSTGYECLRENALSPVVWRCSS